MFAQVTSIMSKTSLYSIYSSNFIVRTQAIEKLRWQNFFSLNKCIKIVIMYIPVLFKRTHKGNRLSPSLPLDFAHQYKATSKMIPPPPQ